MTATRVLLAAATIGGLLAVVTVHHRTPWQAAGLGVMVITLGVLSEIDLRSQLLPNRIVSPLALGTVAGVTIAGAGQAELDRTVAALLTGVAVAAVTVTMHVIGGLGMGDVKLIFPIGVVAGWLGADAVLATAVATTVTGGVAATALLLTRGRGEFSYGPYMALGSVLGMVIGGPA